MVMNVFFDGYEWLLLMLWPCRDPVPIRFRSLRTSPTVNRDQVAVNAIGCMPGVSWRFHWKSSVLFKLSSSTGHNKTITNLDILCIYIYIYMYTYNIYICCCLLLKNDWFLRTYGVEQQENTLQIAKAGTTLWCPACPDAFLGKWTGSISKAEPFGPLVN